MPATKVGPGLNLVGVKPRVLFSTLDPTPPAMRKYILTFFLMSLHFSSAFCQFKLTDSLMTVIRSNAPDSTKINAVNSLPLSVYTPDSILYYATKIIAEGDRQKNELLTAIGWAQMGYGYSRSDNPPQALKAELVGLKIAEKSNNPVVLVTIYENMAISYAYDLPKRMEYARKSIAVIDHSKPNFFYAVSLDNIARYFVATNQLDSALFYAERGYVMDVSMGSHFSKSFIARTLAQIHTLLNDNDLALSFYRVSLNNAVQKNSIRDLHQSYYGLGDFYTHLQKGDSALHYYRLAFGLAGKTGTVSAVINSAQWLYKYYKQKGKADTALFFLESVTDANAQIDATRKAVELQSISFEEALRQQELRAEQERQEQERSHNIQLALLFIAILAAVLLFLLLSRSILVSHRLVELLNVLVLLIVFEFLNLLLHPLLQHLTNDSPFLMLLALVAIGVVIVPFHDRLEKWATRKLVEKNKSIRLAKAKRTIEELERS
jgi:tetratricopeptide (TPR) repeat protein